IAQDSTETQRRLMNTGQADETEVLEAEVEAQRIRMSARMQENTLREEWRSLAAVIGQPGLPLATVAGDLEKGWPEVNEEEAVEERKRISLTLRERAASAVDQYANARLMASEYREEMLPRAKKAYGLMVGKYGQMLASYPRVLDAQRKLYELQIEYIAALESV